MVQRQSTPRSQQRTEINAQALAGSRREESTNYAAAVAPIAFVGAKGICAEELATLTSRKQAKDSK